MRGDPMDTMNQAKDPRRDETRVVRAPRGTGLHCKNWVAHG